MSSKAASGETHSDKLDRLLMVAGSTFVVGLVVLMITATAFSPAHKDHFQSRCAKAGGTVANVEISVHNNYLACIRNNRILSRD